MRTALYNNLISFYEKYREGISALGTVIVSAFLTYLFILFVLQPALVNGNSMAPTLNNMDCVIIDKVSYKIHEPERFDVVVFDYKKDTHYIKRIIGLPGDTVLIGMDGVIRINGEILEEDYGREVLLNPGLAKEPITLGEDEYFVLGDNRNNSTDSRFKSVGPVSKDKIIGKAFFRIYPFKTL